MSYFKVYNLVFTAQMIVPRHIPLPSLVLKFLSLPAQSRFSSTYTQGSSQLLAEEDLLFFFPNCCFLLSCFLCHNSSLTCCDPRPWETLSQTCPTHCNCSKCSILLAGFIFWCFHELNELMEESRTGWAVGNAWPGAWEEVGAVGIVLLNKPSTG